MTKRRKLNSITEKKATHDTDLPCSETIPLRRKLPTQRNEQNQFTAAAKEGNSTPSVSDIVLDDPLFENFNDEDFIPQTLDLVPEELDEFDSERENPEDEPEDKKTHHGYESPTLLGVVKNPSEAERIKTCDDRMQKAVEFLTGKARQSKEEGTSSTESGWINLAFIIPMSRSSPLTIFKIFQQIIPSSTRAALRYDRITTDHLLSLPEVDKSCQDCVGVYLNCARRLEPQQPDATDTVVVNDTNGPESQVVDSVYAGSSTHDLENRVRHQEKEIKYKNSGKRPYRQQVIQEDSLQPNFRVVAVFPTQIPEIGVLGADDGWLIRLLETVIVMFLDAYLPPDPNSFRIRYGVGPEEYFKALDQCGIPRTHLRPLNKALPTKQAVRDRPRRRGYQFEAPRGKRQAITGVLHAPRNFGEQRTDLREFWGVIDVTNVVRRILLCGLPPGPVSNAMMMKQWTTI
ncbi:hypothetical protein NUU61_007824 [Penicillium alfredii]|uniref:Uncharacterized protein n=1 Tax=Penicillium alfredii TaxID=1506179 RepID=A0A9W9ER92_9EURO|nr:uncharacterized protein NUU61_007824 [Penicillium alfredii]KAJ5086517.1 hypothetical protein NUU61_007824 [Penicillium alfredii]